jgi:hypothetical protein
MAGDVSSQRGHGIETESMFLVDPRENEPIKMPILFFWGIKCPRPLFEKKYFFSGHVWLFLPGSNKQ